MKQFRMFTDGMWSINLYFQGMFAASLAAGYNTKMSFQLVHVVVLVKILAIKNVIKNTTMFN